MASKPNIILISADSLRADFLGCYGSEHPVSPHIDKMAAEGVLCEKMFAAAIPTQPSHTAIFTGQHSLTNGVVSHGGKARLARSAPYLSERLLEAGYICCAVDTLFRERIWFARGYEHVIDPSINHVFYANVTQEELNERMLRWIETVPRNKPFFSFIHFWDPHYPYTPPERLRGHFYKGSQPVDPANRALDEWWSHPIGAMARDTWLRTPKGLVTDPDYVTALYRSEILYMDEGIAHMRQRLDQLGLLDNTIIVLLADHGESMTEHRIFYDHYGLYDNVLRVPFVMSWPGGQLRRGARFGEFHQLNDVAPTLLEAAGVPVPSAMDGKSFFGQLSGRDEPSGYDRIVGLESTWQAKYCLRTKTHKFILAREQDLLGNPMKELYDLQADPGELNNIAATQPEIAAACERELEEYIAAKLAAAGRKSDPVCDEGASMIQTWMGHRKGSAQATT